MKYLIVIPVVDEAVTDLCIASTPIEMRNNIFIVDNSPQGFAHKYNVGYYRHFDINQGVARSWNIAFQAAIMEHFDYVVIMSASMVFQSHQAGIDFIEALKKNENKYGMETQFGWHMIAIGLPTIEKIGFFDENFYPGYYEDSDYIRRMELAGIHLPMSQILRLPRVSADMFEQGTALAMKSGINVNMGACRDYFKSKWGGDPLYDSQESRDKLYFHPFNNPDKQLSTWDRITIKELVKKYEL